MPRWRYKKIIDRELTEARLNALGDEEWELVSAYSDPLGNHIHLFKRQVEFKFERPTRSYTAIPRDNCGNPNCSIHGRRFRKIEVNGINGMDEATLKSKAEEALESLEAQSIEDDEDAVDPNTDPIADPTQ